jgi:methylated-DNA-[protein]-cysteine S-methyltransferase
MISAIYASPVGKLTLVSDGAAITHIEFEKQKYHGPDAPRGSDKTLDRVRRELDAYFAGKLKAFETPVAPSGTDFQERAWKALTKIPYGVTWSYGQLAAKIGNPNAQRAVGIANGRNPIPIIVPCHRVIGANGSLTGFGGGVENKRLLLELEQGPSLLR